MNVGILNEDIGIVVIDSLDDLGHIQTERMKNQMLEGANLNDLAFFYMSDRDWIVINKSHELYWFYSETIPVYLELSEKSRKEYIVQVPSNTVRDAFGMLEDVIARRQLIDSLFFKNGGVANA